MLLQRSYQIQQLDHVPPALLEGMLTFIQDGIPPGANGAHLLSRCKFILTELVTNAIKHANTIVTTVTISLTNAGIGIVKTDTGDKFNVPQIKSSEIPAGEVITTDIMHTLYAVTENGLMQFFCYEHPEPSFNDDHNYPEHFGLLIITKASDGFYYRYEQDSRTNTFSVNINF